LVLTRGIAQTISEIQAKIVPGFGASGFFGSPVFFSSPGIYGPAGKGGHGFLAGVSPEATIYQGLPAIAKTESAITVEKLREIVERLPAIEERAPKLTIVCPDCSKSDAISIRGLARKIEGDKAHITAVCQHCNNQFGVHVLRADKTTSECPTDCPFHPSDSSPTESI
jgi:hypothetical protein